MKRAALAALSGLALWFAPSAFGWGSTGHELVSGCAIDGLSKNLPAFLRAKGVRDEIAILGREPDRWKSAGRTHDYERDPGHYINIGDDGLAQRIFSLDDLPTARSDFEMAYRLMNIRPPTPGYLPYSIIDGWQQVVKDFAYWRADKIAAKNAKLTKDRAWFAADMKLREMLTIRDIGVWTHYVGDGSQPLHVSEHHDGWEKYPDPMTYPPLGLGPEIIGIHSYFEGPFVRRNVTAASVRAKMAAYSNCTCSIESRAPAYLKTTLSKVIPFYALVQAGGFRDATAEAKSFAVERIAAGATEARDMIEDAWKASATAVVGYPSVNVADIESGKVILARANFGAD